MQAVILAGGFGTRLAHIVKDVPKPMAPVAQRPFLSYVLRDLAKKGVTKAVLAVGYKKECIENFFGTSFAGCQLFYSEEESPLLTGGAVKKALLQCDDDDVFVVNGDTFFDVDLAHMYIYHKEKHADLTLAVKRMQDFSRYGTVESREGRVFAFLEKQPRKQGMINGGVYLLWRRLLEDMPDAFSLEKDFMEKKIGEKRIFAFGSEGYFIDIGVEEDYLKAQREFF